MRIASCGAFGAVLFEMLTGRRAFEGDDAPGIFAEVLKTEPAWETLPGDVTAAVSAVLRRCLEKEPFQRMRDIADVRMGLHGAFDDAGRPAVDARRASGWGRRALELVVAAAVAGLGVWLLQPSAPREPVRFAIAGAPTDGLHCGRRRPLSTRRVLRVDRAAAWYLVNIANGS